jgi:hypothetical protein
MFGILFYNITSIRCSSTNAVYADYAVIYVIVILWIIPVLVMIIFGCLAYRNIRQTIVLVEQQADRQLTRMTLIQVILVIISIAPYGINSAYRLITSSITKDIDRQIKENFSTTMVTLISYLYYIVCIINDMKCIFNEFFLGKFLYVLSFIKSISSDSERSNILVAKAKSNYCTSG